MQYQVGDVVVLKHSGQEGEIILNEIMDLYQVSINQGKQLLLNQNIELSVFDWGMSDKDKKKNLKFVTQEQQLKTDNVEGLYVDNGFYFILIPVAKNDNPSHSFKIYFINQSKEFIKLSYKCIVKGNPISIVKDEINPFNCLYLNEISLDNLFDAPSFVFDLIFAKSSEYGPLKQEEIKWKSKKLFQIIDDFKNEEKPYLINTLPVQLKSDNWIPKDVKSSVPAMDKNYMSNNTVVKEIDLHIEKLLEDYAGMSNAAILDIQVSAFENALDKAIRNNQSSLTVIHGVGAGKLKAAIHDILKENGHVRHYMSEWSPNYGYGATQIFFNLF